MLSTAKWFGCKKSSKIREIIIIKKSSTSKLQVKSMYYYNHNFCDRGGRMLELECLIKDKYKLVQLKS